MLREFGIPTTSNKNLNNLDNIHNLAIETMLNCLVRQFLSSQTSPSTLVWSKNHTTEPHLSKLLNHEGDTPTNQQVRKTTQVQGNPNIPVLDYHILSLTRTLQITIRARNTPLI